MCAAGTFDRVAGAPDGVARSVTVVDLGPAGQDLHGPVVNADLDRLDEDATAEPPVGPCALRVVVRLVSVTVTHVSTTDRGRDRLDP